MITVFVVFFFVVIVGIVFREYRPLWESKQVSSTNEISFFLVKLGNHYAFAVRKNEDDMTDLMTENVILMMLNKSLKTDFQSMIKSIHCFPDNGLSYYYVGEKKKIISLLEKVLPIMKEVYREYSRHGDSKMATDRFFNRLEMLLYDELAHAA
ncbi:MAG: hypothetical protein WCJ45_06405 [bacterium]